MHTFEWLTYFNLHEAGPHDAKENSSVSSPPWGTGTPPEVNAHSSDLAQIFKNILNRRRSSRNLAQEIPSEVLLEMLSLALGRPLLRPLSRRYPTAGGCDELGILVVARRVENMVPGAYWADFEGASLKKAAEFGREYSKFEQILCRFFGVAITEAPAVTLLIMADWRKLERKYKNCVLASALLDCGGLLQTLSIAAATLRLRACISACIQPALIENWLGISAREYGHIGTLSLGAR